MSEEKPAAATAPHARPVITTARLVLRSFTAADAPDVQRLAGAREIALTTLLIPHPYPAGAAEEWIARHPFDRDNHTFAITLRKGGALVGAVGLHENRDHARGEIGYWIGVPYWGRGYATEAARAVLEYAFEAVGVNRVFALHFVHNPASGRVMQKLGMRHEGHLRQHVMKWGEAVDIEVYGIVREEWKGGGGAAPVSSSVSS
jgi:ribosomal-protein-alanine N-acetyltransferase